MSDSVPAIIQTDLTQDDQMKVAKFVDRGAHGFDLTDGPKISRMMDLYLSGKTYSQIARIQRQPKELVMLYAQKLKWYPLKLEYMQELELHIKGRMVNAKVASQDFLLQLSQMYQKKIGAKMDQYLATNDEAVADKINMKEIDKYLKIVESLHKISSESTPKQGTPAVGLNLGDGVTITKNGDNSVEITPKQKTIGNMLQELANQRREQEQAKIKTTNDIKEVTPNKIEGENGDGKE